MQATLSEKEEWQRKAIKFEDACETLRVLSRSALHAGTDNLYNYTLGTDDVQWHLFLCPMLGGYLHALESQILTHDGSHDQYGTT